jgi:hypothetical protein
MKDEVIWDPDDPRIKPGPGGGGEVPVINSATWSDNNTKAGKLAVEGTAAAKATVLILNGVTGDLLFSLRTPKDGSFYGEKKVSVELAPCTIVAKVDDLVSEAVTVANAPTGCVGAP